MFLAVRAPRIGILASDIAMAMACLGFFTTLPPLPECSLPALYSDITEPTFFCALVIFILYPFKELTNYATRGRFLRKGLFHLVEAAEPYIPITASEANVKQKASALSGDAIPRFFNSSLPSIWILPLDVNE